MAQPQHQGISLCTGQDVVVVVTMWTRETLFFLFEMDFAIVLKTAHIVCDFCQLHLKKIRTVSHNCEK